MSEEPIDLPTDDSPGDAADAASPAASRRPRGDGTADLSRRIEQAVERRPGDQVRCTRVGDDLYRCNWWSAAANGGYDNPGMKGGQLATDHRIRQSRFLRVTRGRGQSLSIVELPSG